MVNRARQLSIMQLCVLCQIAIPLLKKWFSMGMIGPGTTGVILTF